MPSLYRLVPRGDFDGLVCAARRKHLKLIDKILFVHPKDMQDGKVAITSTRPKHRFSAVPRSTKPWWCWICATRRPSKRSTASLSMRCTRSAISRSM